MPCRSDSPPTPSQLLATCPLSCSKLTEAGLMVSTVQPTQEYPHNPHSTRAVLLLPCQHLLDLSNNVLLLLPCQHLLACKYPIMYFSLSRASISLRSVIQNCTNPFPTNIIRTSPSSRSPHWKTLSAFSFFEAISLFESS